MGCAVVHLGYITSGFVFVLDRRQGRIIDFDGAASMEKKKQEGYF